MVSPLLIVASVEGLAFSRLFSPWLHYQMNSLALGPMLFSIGRKEAR